MYIHTRTLLVICFLQETGCLKPSQKSTRSCAFLKTNIICWYELIDSTDIHLELCLISQLSPDLTSSLHPKRLH